MTTLQRSILLMLALPAAALAAPVTVVTHSSGIAYVNTTVFDPFGQNPTQNPGDLPYDLMLTSTFDWAHPLPGRNQWASQADTDVVIDFRAGDLDYHYAGKGSSSTILSTIASTPFSAGGDRYLHEVWIDPTPGLNGYSFRFTHEFTAAAGSLGADGPFAPRVLASDHADLAFKLTAYYSNDEYTFAIPMGGDGSTFSLQVTSPVPEPASSILLAAGVLTLALRRRFGRAPT